MPPLASPEYDTISTTANKAAAIEKALKKAEKNAAGDICGRWEIKLQPSF